MRECECSVAISVSFGVVDPSPYFRELSTATLVLARNTLPYTFVLCRPSDSIVSQTRRTAMRSSSRLVAVLSLSVVISHAASCTGMAVLSRYCS